MANMLGILAQENDNVRVEGLSDYRPVPAISFLGRYRLVDFPISNMTNSGIENIKVFVKKQPRSLIEQLGTGRHYNLNSKRGKLQILYDEVEGVSYIYNNDINSYLQNMEFIEDAREDYVVVTPGYQIYSVDFNDVLRQHIETGADITVMTKKVDDAQNHFLGCPVVVTDENQRIVEAYNNMGQYKRRTISLETYIMSRQLFINLVKEAHRYSSLYTLRDMIRGVLGPKKVYAYNYRGYYTCINSLKAYFDASMELLDYSVAKSLFRADWPIYTRTNDSVPASYGQDAQVTNCMIANGCKIEGTLENCVLGRGVTVGKGSVIRNAVLLPLSKYAENTEIEYAVVDKRAEIVHVKQIKGQPDKIIYIKRRDRI